jgi:hypothetical protein
MGSRCGPTGIARRRPRFGEIVGGRKGPLTPVGGPERAALSPEIDLRVREAVIVAP